MTAESLPTDKLIGQVLANRYQILHRLGEGAMGVVYKARHVKVGRSFAVKVLHARLLADPKVALRFDREAELAGRLRHANVVGVVDVGELEGMRYMVMDFAEGPDLARLLVEAPMPAERIIRLVRQMLEGLYHAHEQGLIHRDFKPENVIIERDTHGAEMPRIVDFGIAILRDGGETADGQGRLTTNGLVLGTPHYMAPEQAVADPIDHRIDLFALGIVIYEMLSGRLPFDGSGAEVARANLLLDPPSIAERVPYLEVDPLLEAFARRLMSKKRSARPATAKLARELLDLIDRDRPAAAAVLGVSAAQATYVPSVTQPVAPQPRVSSYAEPASVQTTRLKATPSPSQPVPPFQATPPPLQSASPPLQPAPPPLQPPPPFQPTPPPFQSAPFQSPVTALPPGPIVFSASPAHDVPTTVQGWGDHETAIQTPLGWPPTPTAKSRRPLLVAGLALSTAGILVALVLVRTGANQDRSAADHVVVTSLGPDTTNAGSPPSSAVADLRAADPKAEDPKAADPQAPDPDTTAPRAADPKLADPKLADPKLAGPTLSTKPPPTHDPLSHEAKAHETGAHNAKAHETKAHDARPARTNADDNKAMGSRTVDTRADDSRTSERRTVDTRADDSRTSERRTVDTRADDSRTSERRTVDTKTVDTKTVDPARAPESGDSKTSDTKTAGISGNSLSELYATVGKQLKQLPTDKSQDLWSRYLLFHIGTLMSEPQAKRDEAAAQLKQILGEAIRRSR